MNVGFAGNGFTNLLQGMLTRFIVRDVAREKRREILMPKPSVLNVKDREIADLKQELAMAKEELAFEKRMFWDANGELNSLKDENYKQDELLSMGETRIKELEQELVKYREIEKLVDDYAPFDHCTDVGFLKKIDKIVRGDA